MKNFQIHKNFFSEAQKLRSEFVVRVSGIVRKRPDGMVNDKMATGGIEVIGTTLEILNQSHKFGRYLLCKKRAVYAITSTALASGGVKC